MKINVDGGVSRMGSTGVVVAFCCDDQGLYLGASALVILGVTDPATLEALACRKGLDLVMDLYLQKLHIASDCLNVINDIAAKTGGKYEAVIKEINTHMSSFTSCNFAHEQRGSNYEAHNLARFASSLDLGPHTWLGVPYDQFCIPMIINQ